MADSKTQAIGMMHKKYREAVRRNRYNHSNTYREYLYQIRMELYSLLMDTETRLYLETNEYLRQCCQIELNEGIDALYNFINYEFAQ